MYGRRCLAFGAWHIVHRTARCYITHPRLPFVTILVSPSVSPGHFWLSSLLDFVKTRTHCPPSANIPLIKLLSLRVSLSPSSAIQCVDFCIRPPLLFYSRLIRFKGFPCYTGRTCWNME
jgi:hypothetical protein